MRYRALDQDKNDDNVYRHGRTKHVGTIANEFHQPVPFFFTRDRMPLHLIGQYRGRSAFMICNGPSLSSGQYDLSLLKKPGVITYGVNNGPKIVRPNFHSVVDDPRRFIKSIWLDPQITKFVPHAHANKVIWDNEKWEPLKTEDGKREVLVGDCPNMVYFHRNEKFMPDRFLYEDTINWGCSGDNGGCRSVMLPVIRILFLLGFRKVFLLGADFKMSENYTYAFNEKRDKGAVNCNTKTYDRMQTEYFPKLKPYFEAENFYIYNCNKDSGLKVFDYVPYEEAISYCTKSLGDIENERTYGLYTKPEERVIGCPPKEEMSKIRPEKIEKPQAHNFQNIQRVEAPKPIVKPIIKPNVEPNRIVRSMPCGEISMGSSRSNV